MQQSMGMESSPVQSEVNYFRVLTTVMSWREDLRQLCSPTATQRANKWRAMLPARQCHTHRVALLRRLDRVAVDDEHDGCRSSDNCDGEGRHEIWF
jgi:hypothetical protein